MKKSNSGIFLLILVVAVALTIFLCVMFAKKDVEQYQEMQETISTKENVQEIGDSVQEIRDNTEEQYDNLAEVVFLGNVDCSCQQKRSLVYRCRIDGHIGAIDPFLKSQDRLVGQGKAPADFIFLFLMASRNDKGKEESKDGNFHHRTNL